MGKVANGSGSSALDALGRSHVHFIVPDVSALMCLGMPFKGESRLL
jgi:hypothetical protein